MVTSNSSLLMGIDRLSMLISFLRVVPCVGGSRRAVIPSRLPKASPIAFLTASYLQRVQGWRCWQISPWLKLEGETQCWQWV